MSNRILGWVAAGIAALLVSGCTQAPLEPGYSMEGKANTGVVLVSLVRGGTVEPSLLLKLRGVDHRYSAFVVVDDYGTKRDWAKIAWRTPPAINDRGHASREEPIGHVAAFALPAGEYEFYAWFGASPQWGQDADSYDVISDNFSVKFTVRPGVVTYLGRLQINLPDFIYADARIGNFELAVSDQMNGDGTLLREKYPGLAGQPITTQLMTTANAGQSLVFHSWPKSGPWRNGGGGFD